MDFPKEIIKVLFLFSLGFFRGQFINSDKILYYIFHRLKNIKRDKRDLLTLIEFYSIFEDS